MDNSRSLAGQTVAVDAILWENPNLAHERRKLGFSHGLRLVTVPAGHRTGGVSSAEYDAYRTGLDSACADIVLCTILKDGTPAVLATKRAEGRPFGGCWWMQGGAVHSYRSLLEFVAERAKIECGVAPKIEGLIGFYRTCAGDAIASTMQPCYVATVAFDTIRRAKADADHTNWVLLRLEDMPKLPENERHWYPMHAFERALKTMPPGPDRS